MTEREEGDDPHSDGMGYRWVRPIEVPRAREEIRAQGGRVVDVRYKHEAEALVAVVVYILEART